MKNDFLFEIGESVRYCHKGNAFRNCTIIARNKRLHGFLSLTGFGKVYFNEYTTSEVINNKKREYLDNELHLHSLSFDVPDDAVDYDSDENTVDFLDINGNILKTIKSGKIGFANEYAINHFNKSA